MTVDTNLGIDIPRSRNEAMSVALRLAAEEFTYGEETTKLDTLERGRLVGDLEVSLSPFVGGVADVDGGIAVSFKRYLPGVRLAGSEARLVTHLRNGARCSLRAFPMVAGVSAEEVNPLVRRLEQARILRADARPS